MGGWETTTPAAGEARGAPARPHDTTYREARVSWSFFIGNDTELHTVSTAFIAKATSMAAALGLSPE